MALQALPKGARATGAEPAVPLNARLGRIPRLASLLVAFAAFTGAAALIVAAIAPGGTRATCPAPASQCGAPPTSPLPVRGLTTWTSALNGGTRISLSYAANQWTAADQGADTLRLDSVAGDLQLELSVVPADDDSTPALVDGRVTDLGTHSSA